MSSFQLLDQREEDELHKTRLLNVEEKPFKRITKRLLTPGSNLFLSTKLPTPPPDSANSDGSPADAESEEQTLFQERRQFREDVLLDFVAFDSSIARLQFLRNSNERERERYAAERIRILEAAQEVKDNTALLRVQLDSAKSTLNQRKKFDELAEKISNNRLLRPREDQEINLLKLEEECRELEKESHTYSETWKERREQFGRIMEEAFQLRRLIRDEKEEVDRREGMDVEEDGEVGEAGSRGGQTPKHSSQSGAATPHDGDAPTPGLDGVATPQPRSPRGDETPAQDVTPEGSRHAGLKPRLLPFGLLSGPGSRVTSRTSSPAGLDRRKEEPEGEDMTMDYDAVKDGERETAADTPMGEGADNSLSEGEAREGTEVRITEPPEDVGFRGAQEDQMDIT